jgi:hypothetical protein
MRKGGAVKCPENRAKPIGAGTGPVGVVREGSAPARLPDESDKEYLWFQGYWREGAARSLREMAARMGVVPSTFSRTRIRQRWDARIQAALEEPPEVKQGWLARREELREEEWKLHQECLEAGREALRNWRESGKTATLGDLVKLLEFGAKLARLAAGMPDNHTMITGEEGEPIRVQFEAALAQAYGPVVDAVSEVVEVQSEKSLHCQEAHP